jgi:hypothetical protein
MHDILDSMLKPMKLGMISTEPYRLAKEALKAIKVNSVPTTPFVDPLGAVFAPSTVYAADHSTDEIIGIYVSGISIHDIADDLRASAGPRLAAIGILVNWPDACVSVC